MKNTTITTLLLGLLLILVGCTVITQNSSQETLALENHEIIKLGDNHYQTYTDIVIDAPIEKVWQVLINFDEMANWSSSFKGISGEIKNGANIHAIYFLDGTMNKIPHTFIYKEGKEYGWSDPMGGPFEGFQDNHRFTVEKISETKTRFIQTDDFKSIGEAQLTSEDIASRTVKEYPVFNKQLKKQVELTP